MKTLLLDAMKNGTIGTYNQQYIWLTMLSECYCSNWYFALVTGEFMFGTQRIPKILHSFEQLD